MEQSAQKIRLKLPEQDLQYLTIGSDQPKKLQIWVNELPLMNMGETSRQLYQYVQELNRFQVPTPQRFLLLEIIRPVVLHVCRALGKHYLNQSLVLPDKARRVASLAQALQTHLAAGYKLVAVRGFVVSMNGTARLWLPPPFIVRSAPRPIIWCAAINCISRRRAISGWNCTSCFCWRK